MREASNRSAVTVNTSCKKIADKAHLFQVSAAICFPSVFTDLSFHLFSVTLDFEICRLFLTKCLVKHQVAEDILSAIPFLLILQGNEKLGQGRSNGTMFWNAIMHQRRCFTQCNRCILSYFVVLNTLMIIVFQEENNWHLFHHTHYFWYQQ